MVQVQEMAIQNRRGSYIPIFLSEAAYLFRKGHISIDTALISVSPPDKHGFCSLGTSVDISLAAIERAQHVIAQVNCYIPRTHGDGIIHINDINQIVEYDEPLPECHQHKITPEEAVIGKHISELIDDYSTIQMGIGSIPNAILGCLNNHKDIGIHTEMFSDGLLPLIKKGVITGKFKQIDRAKIVASFVVGSASLYRFLDDNPQVKMLDSAYVNHPNIISQNHNVVAVNSAIEIDLTGQICADSIGHHIFFWSWRTNGLYQRSFYE